MLSVSVEVDGLQSQATSVLATGGLAAAKSGSRSQSGVCNFLENLDATTTPTKLARNALRPQHATRIARRGPMPVTQRPSLPCARGPIVSGVQGRSHQPRWIDLRRQPLTGDDDTVDNRSTMQDLVNTATLASTTTPPHQEPPSIIPEPVAHRQIPRGWYVTSHAPTVTGPEASTSRGRPVIRATPLPAPIPPSPILPWHALHDAGDLCGPAGRRTFEGGSVVPFAHQAFRKLMERWRLFHRFSGGGHSASPVVLLRRVCSRPNFGRRAAPRSIRLQAHPPLLRHRGGQRNVVPQSMSDVLLQYSCSSRSGC